MRCCVLNVNGKIKKGNEINYDDLLVLYKQFIDKYKKFPTSVDLVQKNNMPQMRIVNRILKESGHTFNELCVHFGKVKHVRTESKDYGLFVKKYCEVCDSLGRALTIQELMNNHYALPSAGWFVKYCPDKNVDTYDKFVKYCGYESNILKLDYEYVAKSLINLEKELNRPLKATDITIENVGFTPIVITRIFGSLNKAKRKLGLSTELHTNLIPLENYKKDIKTTLDNIKKLENRTIVTWHDIESTKYNSNKHDHKTYKLVFEREGKDFFKYIKELGFTMDVDNKGISYHLDSGEICRSTFERDFSMFLENECDLYYKRDYRRDVMYREFSDDNSKKNCDYEITINGEKYYIEICGLIHNGKSYNWRENSNTNSRNANYQNKMIKKEQLLINADKKYLFLFPEDMLNDIYKAKVKKFLYNGGD